MRRSNLRAWARGGGARGRSSSTALTVGGYSFVSTGVAVYV